MATRKAKPRTIPSIRTFPKGGAVETPLRSDRIATVEDFLKPRRLRKQYVPKLDAWVFIRDVPAVELIRYRAITKGEAEGDMAEESIKMIARALAKEDGSPLFDEDDLRQLREVNMETFGVLAEILSANLGPKATAVVVDMPQSVTESTK